jgi:DNA end-binding protein Ku
MSARSILSGVITFGLVSVPVKVYTAASAENVSFNMLTPAGNRVKQSYTDAVTGDKIEQRDCNKGYEVAKDQYVVFTADEIKALEAERDKIMDIKEFVDADSLDPAQVEKSYYLGPDKGGDKAYLLLSETMNAMGKVAVAQWAARGKEQLVIIRPYKGGLILHQMYYANEVRDFSEVPSGKLPVSDAERNMAGMLVSALSTGAFEPTKYEDGYVKRVQAAIERKTAGIPAPVVPSAPAPAVIDLLAALKASIEAAAKK